MSKLLVTKSECTTKWKCPNCQYFMCPPLFSITASTLLGMEFTRASQVATGVHFHSSMTTSRSWWMLWRFSTAWYGTVRHGSVRYGTAQFGSGYILANRLPTTSSNRQSKLWYTPITNTRWVTRKAQCYFLFSQHGTIERHKARGFRSKRRGTS